MTPPPHVLMTTDAVGGVWRYALDLAEGLCRRGGRVTLALLGPPPDQAQRIEAAAIEDLALLDTGLALDWLAPDAATVMRAGGAIARLAAQHGVDLVHLNGPAPAAGATYGLPVLAACHSCVATWWHAVRGDTPLPADLAWRRALVAEGCRAADLLVAPSAAFAVATAQTYRLPQVPRVVHNGGGLFAGRPMPPRSLPADFALAVGRLWDEGKGIATLDQAAAQVPLPVLAAGPTDGPHGGSGAFPHLRMLGTLTPAGIAGCLAARPIFVSPSRYEPFGLAVLEAAQSGCALVLSDIPTFRELWSDAAVFVPPGDATALVHALRHLSAHPAERARLGAAARTRAGRYGKEAMVERTLTLYRDLIRSPAVLEDAG